MVCVFVMAAKAPVVLAVKQSVKLHGSFHRQARQQARQQGCMEGEFNSFSTVNLVFLGPMHNRYFSVYTWWMWHKTYNSATNRLVQKVTIIFVNTFMVNMNIQRYLTGSFLIAHIKVRYSPLYYGLLILPKSLYT